MNGPEIDVLGKFQLEGEKQKQICSSVKHSLKKTTTKQNKTKQLRNKQLQNLVFRRPKLVGKLVLRPVTFYKFHHNGSRKSQQE